MEEQAADKRRVSDTANPATLTSRPLSFVLGALGCACWLVSLLLLVAKFPAFDAALRVAAQFLSPDGTVTDTSLFAALLFRAAAGAAVVGTAFLALAKPQWRVALATVLYQDALRDQGMVVPNPRVVFLAASLAGASVVGLWIARSHMGAPVAVLFAKEGPLEMLTFVLELAAAALCAGAALKWKRRELHSVRAVPLLYGCCGFVLLIVAMEEVSWGQTLLGFRTPDAWARLNFQGETSLHNLADRDALTYAWKLVAVGFALGALASTALAVRLPRSWVSAVAPHPSLAFLAVTASYSGVALHPELIELLLAVFFAFYSYRIYVAARSRSTVSAASTPSSRLRSSPNVWRLGRYAVAAAFVLTIGYHLDWSKAIDDLSRIPPALFILLVGTLAVGQIVSGWRWMHALKMHGLEYSFVYLLRALGIGFFLNSFLPTAVGGDAYRVYRTLPHDGHRSRALSAVVVERAAGLLALLMLGAIGALTLLERSAVARMFFVGLTTVSLIGVLCVVALELGWLRGAAARWRNLPGVDAIHHNAGLLSGRGPEWAAIFGASVAFQAISIGVVFVLFTVLGSHATFAQCALITAAAGVAGMLPVAINGIGVMEGALVGTAVALGLDYEHAVVVALLRRLAAMCLAGLFGLYSLVDGNLRRYRAVDVSSDADVPLAAAVSVGVSGIDRAQTELLEYTHDAVIIWEMNGRGIVYWNRAAEQLYGFTRREAYGKITHTLLSTQLIDGVSVLEAHLARFGVWVGELRHTSREGRHVYVEARLALMSQVNERWLVLEVNRDISDRKAAEAASRAMELQLEALQALRDSSTRTAG